MKTHDSSEKMLKLLFSQNGSGNYKSKGGHQDSGEDTDEKNGKN